MKVMLATTPIRPVPTAFPPFGSLTLMKYLRKNGFNDLEFYNIDGNRPSYEEVLDHIRAAKPDVFGISAVVSTAYEYSKRLSLDVKRMLPDTLIVLGGNMGASANVLLRRTGVDMCVLGEGEQTFLNVVQRAQSERSPLAFRDIKGLTLLDKHDTLINTGYEVTLPGEQLYDVDWSDLEASSDIGIYFRSVDDPDTHTDHYEDDERFKRAVGTGKTIGYLYTSKGCVSRCTFCHRWDKGIRFIPVDTVMRRLDEIIERYNVGFLNTADENFGTDRKWLGEFCAEIKKRNILWRAGTRARGMNRDTVALMRDAGCTAIVFGNETGSERMLEVMEKKVSIEDNYNAVKWTIEAGLGSKVQLVCGMPGESPETIRETIEFCKFTNTISERQNPNDLSINYAQALPGTPLYEYARHSKLIGQDLDGEEEYLLKISDRDAHDEYTTLNFTNYPKLICETWRPLITVEVNYYYYKKFGADHYRYVMFRDTEYFRHVRPDSGYYANPRRLIETGAQTGEMAHKIKLPSLFYLIRRGNWGLALICHPAFAYHARHFLWLLVIVKDLRNSGLRQTAKLVGEYLNWQWKRVTSARKFEYKSLRKLVDNDLGALPSDEVAMAPLRKGR